jgi:universal stress protein A
MTITRILVPTDFSADASAAFAYARELARVFDATVHLLHVVEYPLAASAWSSEIYTAEIAGLQLNLVRDAEQHLRGLAADDSVMGTRGRTGLAHVIVGSVAERVVRFAPCPVLTLRGDTTSHIHDFQEAGQAVAGRS